MPAKITGSGKRSSQGTGRSASKTRPKSAKTVAKKSGGKGGKPAARRGGTARSGAAADSLANPGKAVRSAFLSRLGRGAR